MNGTLAALQQLVRVYEPRQFRMYTSCVTAGYSNPKHNVDMHFVPRVLSNFAVVGAEPSSLFVLPVLCTRSYYGLCSTSHAENLRQLATVLQHSPHFAAFPERHLLVCEDNAAREAVRQVLGPRILLGLFEEHKHEPHTTIAVGYTTYADIGYCQHSAGPAPPPRALEERTYDVISLMSIQMPPPKRSAAYARRQLLWCDWLNTRVHRMQETAHALVSVPDDRDVHCTRSAVQEDDGLLAKAKSSAKVVPKCEAMAIMADSRMVLSLAGDTPTTDRLFNAFDSETAVLVLSDELPALLRRLPFPSVIPWRKVLQLVVPTSNFTASPLRSITRVATKTSLRTLGHVIALMRLHRNDVRWSVQGSRATWNVLHEALRKVRLFRAS